ncbi:MAG: hypothetical protein P8Y44_00885 [Acidobacteriota bacterium]
MPSLLGREEAGAALRRWMASSYTVKNLDRKSELLELEPISFPMWLFRLDDRGDEISRVTPATALPIPQLMDLEFPPGRLEPYQGPSERVEQEITIPIDAARAWLDRDRVGTIREISLVQVPLWSCRYRYAGSDYLAVVDANSGQVLASIYPEKADSPYLFVLGLGFVLFLVEGLLIGNPFLKAVVFAMTALPMIALAYWVARKV